METSNWKHDDENTAHGRVVADRARSTGTAGRNVHFCVFSKNGRFDWP